MPRRSLVLALAFVAGCSGQSQPNGGASGSTPSGDPEAVVRAAVAARFKVDPSAVDMNRPLSAAPFNADDLDLVELVLAIEERLGVEIPDEKVEEMKGSKSASGPIQITPAQLVSLAKQATPGSKSNRR